MKTLHQFVLKYPIRTESKKLILGTIHPHYTHDFEVQFFYGNKSSIWKILNEAFDNEIGQPITVNGIIAFLNSRKISVSDTILECLRKNQTALDSDLIPEVLNTNLIQEIKNSDIDEILFTSGFGKNNAFKLFYEDILHQKITDKIKEEKSILLDPTHFGRPVLLKILVSPSGSANIQLSRSKKYLDIKHQYIGFKTPIKQYKIDLYRSAFSK
jgi:G:T/U-mismatch repair DNA glycosylase